MSDSDPTQLKVAYERLEAAIEEVCRLEGSDGVMTEWVVLICHQRFDDDGDGISEYGKLVPHGGRQMPHHRVMGLLDFQLTRLRAEAVEE